MPRSKCPACSQHEFEAVQVVNKSGQKFCLIQCSACGTVVGAVDDVRIANVIRKAERKLALFVEKFNPAVAMKEKNGKR